LACCIIIFIWPKPWRLFILSTRSHSGSNNSSRSSQLSQHPYVESIVTSHLLLSRLTCPAANQPKPDQCHAANHTVEDNHQAFCYHHVSQENSLNAGGQPANVNAMDLQMTRQSFCPMHSQDSNPLYRLDQKLAPSKICTYVGSSRSHLTISCLTTQ